MIEAESDHNQKQSSTQPDSRRRVRLILLSILLLLIVGFIILSAFYPSSLNPAEKRLLGRWVHAGASLPPSDYVEYSEHYWRTKRDPENKIWFAEPSTLADHASVVVVPIRGYEFWTRLQFAFGMTPAGTERYDIEFIDESNYVMSSPMLVENYSFEKLD